ncbi:TetR/AcrR family transcriptional regulator [uncultured Paracoccus sp.]|uniref:TetR/AcrR family transcriptional regulator n=1 Tax=uncultured Paracoccus sp. TaxID=189685 RepID=UPI0025FDF584|nr:TetR/AcrR family transcriptional regulator [uncultured Paracoccus sp.]
MGRNRVIDRDKVLDAAEQVVAGQGAAGLTFEAVARAAGITKGGVQSCFGTKDALIEAIFNRWGRSYDQVYDRMVARDSSGLGRVQAHVVASSRSDKLANAKSASLTVALALAGEHAADLRAWYRSRIEGLDLSDPASRRALCRFLAVEGAFMLRYLELLDLTDEEWDGIFNDLSAGDPLGTAGE